MEALEAEKLKISYWSSVHLPMWNHGEKAPLTGENDMWIVAHTKLEKVPHNIPMVEKWNVVLAHIQESNLLPENYTKHDM